MHGHAAGQAPAGKFVARRACAVEGVGMRLSFTDAFRDRAVFLTGHTGFKGSWLAIWLGRLGARVTGYALAPPSDPSNYVSSRIGELVERSHCADVRDFAALRGALDASGAEIVIHMAAQALVRRSYMEARETFDVNVM